MGINLEILCQKFNLLFFKDNVIRVPFLVKGELLTPPEIKKKEIEAAFSNLGGEITYTKLSNAQVLREPVIERTTMRATSEYLYQLLPLIDPYDLIETDIEKLSQGPYSLSIQDILSYLQTI